MRARISLMLLRFAAFVTPLLFVACGSAQTPPRSQPDSGAEGTKAVGKRELQALLRRELGALPTLAVSAPNQAWSATIEARSVRLLRHEGAVEIQASLGTEQPLRCFVYDHPIEVGGALAKVFAESQGAVRYERITPMAVTPVGVAPVLIVDALYTTETAGKGALGQLKLAAYGSPSAPAVCVHDELGYTDTFARVVTGLARSLVARAPSTDRNPAYVELHVARLGERAIGYHRRALYREKDRTVARLSSAVVMSRAGGQIVFEDADTVLELNAQLRLEKGVWVRAANGAITTHIELERSGPQRYAYKGTHAAEDVRGTFEARDANGLGSELSNAELVKGVLAGRAGATDVEEYHPTIDPRQPTRVHYSKSNTPGHVDVTIGKMTLAAVPDERGLFRRIVVSAGAAKLVSERAVERGSF
jgi:hypothetical protein